MKTPISYYGGKQKLAPHITKLLKSSPHKWTTYVEPFAGGAAVFFAIVDSVMGKRFVLNDKNELIACFYQCGQNPAKRELLVALTRERGIVCESFYNRAREIWKGVVVADDIEKAWAVFYLSRTSFGGSFDSSFRIVTKNIVERRHERVLQTHIDALPVKLAALHDAWVLCRDAVSVLQKYDYADALFYIDPPYVESYQGHYSGYSEDQFSTLLQFLSKTKASFVLSHYRIPLLEKAIVENGWEVKSINTRTTAMGHKGDNARVELLVYNYTETGAMLDI